MRSSDPSFYITRLYRNIDYIFFFISFLIYYIEKKLDLWTISSRNQSATCRYQCKQGDPTLILKLDQRSKKLDQVCRVDGAAPRMATAR